jgi:hypothetical protein
MSALLHLPILDRHQADALLAWLGDQAQLQRLSGPGDPVGILWVANAAIDDTAAREMVVHLLDAHDPSWRRALGLPETGGRHRFRDGYLADGPCARRWVVIAPGQEAVEVTGETIAGVDQADHDLREVHVYTYSGPVVIDEKPAAELRFKHSTMQPA